MAHAVITGASGGIGLCLAQELAARKYDLLLIARSEERLKNECQKLQDTFHIKASWLALDLSRPGAVAAVQNYLQSNSIVPEVLINNAGYGLWGPVENITPSDLENMMQLNMNTLVQLCRMMIPLLKKNKTAWLMNVASTAAYQAVPTLSTYAATKAFVVLFTRGLRWELKDTGISVSCLSPGATSTGFIDRAGMESLKEKAEKFSMKPSEVAKIAIKGMFQQKSGDHSWLHELDIRKGYLPASEIRD